MEFVTHRATGPFDDVMIPQAHLKNLYIVLYVKKISWYKSHYLRLKN